LKGHGFSRAAAVSNLGSAALQRRVGTVEDSGRADLQVRVRTVEGHGFSRAMNAPSDVGFSAGPRLKPTKMAHVDGGLKSAASTAGPQPGASTITIAEVLGR